MATIHRSVPTASRARAAASGPSEWDSMLHVLDALPGYVLLVDDQHHIILANKAALARVGRPPSEVLGRYCPRVMHGLDGPFPGCPVEQAAAKGAAAEVEYHDEKTGRWLVSGAYPTSIVSPTGRRVFLHTTRDVTELRTAQERVAMELEERTALFELLEASLADSPLDDYLDRSLRLLTSLPWLRVEDRGAIFIVGDEPDVLVMHAQRRLSEFLLHECARVRFGHCLCGRAAETGEPVTAADLDARHETTYEGIHNHGHTCIPLRSPGSGVLGVLNLYVGAGHVADQREIAFLSAAANVLAATVERKRAEARVRDYQHNLESLVAQRTAQLAESNQKRQSLIELAVMHDFGTPMTVLSTGIDILENDKSLTPNQRRLVEMMARNLATLNGARSSMLDVIGLGSGSIVIKPERLDASELLANAATDAAPLLAAREAMLETVPTTAEVVGDTTWLRRAVLSLILAVCKYAANGARVRLRADSNDGGLTVTVTDTSAAGAGEMRWASGLELALVHAVAEAHGGSAGHRTGPGGAPEGYITIPATAQTNN